jgi:hypothetical protein
MAESGGCENYSVADEHIRIENPFFNNFIKTAYFLCDFFRMDENSGCLNTG